MAIAARTVADLNATFDLAIGGAKTMRFQRFVVAARA